CGSAVTAAGVRGAEETVSSSCSPPLTPGPLPRPRAPAGAPQPTLLAVIPPWVRCPLLGYAREGPGGLRVSRWAGYSRPNGTRARALWRSAACRMPADLERSALLAVIQSGLSRGPLLAVIQVRCALERGSCCYLPVCAPRLRRPW